MKANIMSVYLLATPYEKKEGMNWYTSDARQFCLVLGWQVAAHFGQLTEEISDRHWSKFVAAVVAVMSPQTEWRTNKAKADYAVNCVLKGEPVVGHYPVQCAKVVKLFQYFLIHRGEAFSQEDVLKIISKAISKKTRNFYLNIIGVNNVVTIDRHAVAIADYGTQRVAITQIRHSQGRKYDKYAEAYKEVAAELKITPAQLQAITWLTYRRLDLVVQ